MRKSGLAFHCHHDTLMEYVYDYDERVRYIKSHKPKKEQKLRLRLFKIIPRKLLPAEGLEACDEAGEAFYKAWRAHDKAWCAYHKAWEACDEAGEAFYKAWVAYYETGGAYHKAWEACDKAGEAYLRKHKGAISKLHSELCPNCPWDGETIFGGKV